MSMKDRTYRLVTEKADVTEEILDYAIQECESYYDEDKNRFEKDEFIDGIDGLPLEDGTYLDLGPKESSPAINYLVREARKELGLSR